MTTLHFIPWVKNRLHNREVGHTVDCVRSWPDTRVDGFPEVLLMLLNNSPESFDAEVAETLRQEWREWRRRYE